MLAKSFLAFSLALLPSLACAGESLLYFEGQAVGGYSSAEKGAVWHSMSASDPMQKTSAGFDLLRKFSGGAGDLGTLAVQARLAWDKAAPDRLEPQVYNAYYRFRTPYAYVWAGHARPAAGLESYFDTHGALLQTLPMYGFGFDRDWGAGANRDFDWGGAAVSLTSGSGMRLSAPGTYVAAGRVAKGVLNRDNYTAGLYAASGRAQGITGYRVTDPAVKPYSAAGADCALLLDAWEFRADLRAGTARGASYTAGLARAGLNLLDENRLKLEAQAVYSGMERMRGWALAAGAAYAATPDLTWRAMYEYQDRMHDKRVVAQLYYYLPL
jgi:opacity protein-like surface antigen